MAFIKKLLSKQSGLFGPGGENMEKETYRMMVNSLERVKHSFPSRVSLHPKLCGTILQVHSAVPGRAATVWGTAEIPCAHQSSQWPWDPGATASIWGVCQAGAGPAARWRMSVGVPLLTSCPLWDWQSSITGKNAASTRQQDKRFYKEVSVWEMPAALRYCREEKQWPESCCPGRFSTKACANPFTALNRDIPVFSEPGKWSSSSSCLWGVPGAAEQSVFKLKKKMWL